MQGDRFQRERNYLKQKWGAETLEADPNFNPNLRLDNEEAYQVAAPPRVTKPWLGGSERSRESHRWRMCASFRSPASLMPPGIWSNTPILRQRLSMHCNTIF